MNAPCDLPPLAPERPRLVTARKFLADLKPIESIIDGLSLGRGAVVSITGATGHGKTTLCAAMQAALRTGRPFAGREVTDGSVLVLAGENPDDYGMHLMATLQQAGIDRQELSNVAANTHLLVIPGVFDLDRECDWLDHAVGSACENLVSAFVDTSAAFYSADDENDNVAMRRHASKLRELTKLPGNPTVFVLCHPTKNATRDNLQPRGGGSFLAEVDVNLTVWKDEAGIVTLHHTKIRGAPFDPIRFELVPVELEGYRDARDRPIFSVAARHLADEKAEQLEALEADRDDRMLVAMLKRPGATIRDLAMECGMVSSTFKPLTAKVDRQLKKLKSHGLVDQDRHGTWRLTPKGKKEADQLP